MGNYLPPSSSSEEQIYRYLRIISSKKVTVINLKRLKKTSTYICEREKVYAYPRNFRKKYFNNKCIHYSLLCTIFL